MPEFRKEIEDYFCRFTFGQFVSIILLELATLFFVFYLGARYGPDLIGNRKETPVASTDEEAKEKRESSDLRYTFPEALPDSSGQTAIKVKPSGVTAREYDTRPREAPVESSPPVVVPAPVEKPTVAAPPSPPKRKTQGVGALSIQVGAYQTADEAAKQVTRWQSKGYSSFMTVAEIPKKGTWYRVRIGAFDQEGEAKAFLEKFKQREKTDAFIVRSKG